METFPFWHWVVLPLVFLPNLMFIPAIRKTGYSAWWVVLSFVPLIGFVVLWLWAYAKWPAQPGR